jgi:hypothetical protein
MIYLFHFENRYTSPVRLTCTKIRQTDLITHGYQRKATGSLTIAMKSAGILTVEPHRTWVDSDEVMCACTTTDGGQ